MKVFSLWIWVAQFGFSALFPLCAFLLVGSWLQRAYELGDWVMILSGLLGLFTTVPTVRSCLRALRKEAEKGQTGDKPVAFNDHT